MTTAELGILLSLKDEASPQLRTFSKGLMDQRSTLREMSMGMREVGAGVLGLGVALRAMNIPAAQTLSNMLLFVGGLMTAVAAIPQFIRAVSMMIDALKKLAQAEIIAKAFSGPAGWAMLAGGAAVAAGTMYAVNRRSEGSAASPQKVVIQNQIMLDGKQIGAVSRKETVLTQSRNGTVTQR